MTCPSLSLLICFCFFFQSTSFLPRSGGYDVRPTLMGWRDELRDEWGGGWDGYREDSTCHTSSCCTRQVTLGRQAGRDRETHDHGRDQTPSTMLLLPKYIHTQIHG